MPETADLSLLCNKLLFGYAINSVFKNGKVTATTKTKQNFKQSNIIAFDFDGAPCPMEQFTAKLAVQPTISYKTPSDGLKGNRFRLLYAFDSPFTSTTEYGAYYNAIKQAYFPDFDTDNSLATGVQNIGGAKLNTRVICTNNVFSKEDFTINNAEVTNEEKHAVNASISPEILDDVKNMPFMALVEKYRNIYPHITQTPLEYHNGYADIPENFYKIKRKWHLEEDVKQDGDVKFHSVETKANDGDMRRRMMYIQCLLRRKMLPSITLEHLFLNLVYERQYYFNNSDNQLTNKVLLDICISAMKVKNIKIKPTDDKRAFEVDKTYWAKLNMNANQAKQVIKKGKKYEMIGKYYNPEKTDKENLKILEENGVKCSQRTLTTFKQEQGLTRKKQIGN